MDYCNTSNQIGTYAPSGSGGSGGGGCCDPLVVKNIDCVTAEADTITANSSLTVNGVNILNLSSDLNSKTQFQAATTTPSNKTIFTGSVEADNVSVATGTLTSASVNVNTLTPIGSSVNFNTPISVTGAITGGSSLTVTDASTGSSTVGSFLQAGLTTGQTQIVLGQAASTNSSAVIGYNRNASDATQNYAFMSLWNNANGGPRIYSDRTNFPLQVTVGTTPTTGAILRPRLNGTMANMSSITTTGGVSFTWTADTNVRKIVIMFNNAKKATNAGLTFLRTNIHANTTYSGITWGTQGAANQTWTTTGIPIWNTTWPTTTTYTMMGSIEITYMGLISGLETWNVSGSMTCPENLTTGSPTNYFAYPIGQIQSTISTSVVTGFTLVNADSNAYTQGQVNILYY